MKNKYVFVAVLLAVILAAGMGLTSFYVNHQETEQPEDELVAVTSFYPMYIAAKNVIGDCEGVRLQNLSEPQTGCLHDYQLTAEDMKLLAAADVFIVNGGGIESFLTDVVSEYPDLKIINACENLGLEEDNPHAWMSMSSYLVQLETIRDGLIQADPEKEEIYRINEAEYAGQVQELMDNAQDLTEILAGQPVILFHEAYEYVADDYGLNVVGVMDLDEERQVSAGEVADIMSAIEEYDVPVILAEELYGKDMGDMMEAQAGVEVVYLDALTRGNYEADSYLKGMEQNIALLREVFQ